MSHDHDSQESHSSNDVEDDGYDDDMDHDGNDNDTHHGTSSDDSVYSSAGNDMLYGGDGDDQYHGGLDDDDLFGESGHDHLYGDDGNDNLEGGEGDDYFQGGHGDDSMIGGNGFDSIDYLDSDYSVSINLSLRTAQNTGWGLDYIEGIEEMTGSHFDDKLTGSKVDDHLNGDEGDDSLKGGDGDDHLNGGLGDDEFNGGNGFDVADYSDSALGIAVNLAKTSRQDTHQGYDKLISIEEVIGSDYDDDLNGSSKLDTLTGGSGADRLDGGLGSDDLTGGVGADVFEFTTSLGKLNIDRVADFESGIDSIELEDKIFKKLKNDTDLSDNFYINGSGIQDKDDYLVYDLVSGVLSYDKDGSASSKALQIAIVGNGGVNLTYVDFDIV